MKRSIIPYLKFFDVSITDRLKSTGNVYSLKQKQMILNNVFNTYKPSSMEIGELDVNNSFKMKDSLELYNYAESFRNSNYYLRLPPIANFIDAANKKHVRNISLDTSVSNKYQMGKYNMDLDTTYENIESALSSHHNFQSVKLNVSCVNKCPVSNKYIKNEKIVDEILRYCKFRHIKEICLTDTTGTLKYDDFQSIMDDLLNHMGPGRLGLHLNNANRWISNDIERIFLGAIYRGIYRFDVANNGIWDDYENPTFRPSTVNYEQLNCYIVTNRK